MTHFNIDKMCIIASQIHKIISELMSIYKLLAENLLLFIMNDNALYINKIKLSNRTFLIISIQNVITDIKFDLSNKNRFIKTVKEDKCNEDNADNEKSKNNKYDKENKDDKDNEININ